MYYKFYRRRQYIYLIATIFGFLFIFNYRDSLLPSFSSSSSSSRDSNARALGESGDDSEINMLNYKPPEPCVDCPGENGQPVYLTVIPFIVIVVVQVEIFYF